MSECECGGGVKHSHIAKQQQRERRALHTVVELSLRQVVVEVLHFVPRTVADTDHDDAQREVAGTNDGRDVHVGVGNLTYGWREGVVL